MPTDQKVNELTVLTTPGTTDVLPVVDNSGAAVTKKIQVSTLDARYFYKAGLTGGQTAIGGTDTTDILNLQGTSGNGTATSAAIKMLVGNNGGTVAMTILNNGYVGIGISPAYQLQLSTNSATKPTSEHWTTVSDFRLKEDIIPFSDGLSVLTQLNPVQYTLNGKAGFPRGEGGVSLIAQDVKDIIPYCIGTFKAKLNPEDVKETELYDINSSALMYVTINALKEQKRLVDNLITRTEKLELGI